MGTGRTGYPCVQPDKRHAKNAVKHYSVVEIATHLQYFPWFGWRQSRLPINHSIHPPQLETTVSHRWRVTHPLSCLPSPGSRSHPQSVMHVEHGHAGNVWITNGRAAQFMFSVVQYPASANLIKALISVIIWSFVGYYLSRKPSGALQDQSNLSAGTCNHPEVSGIPLDCTILKKKKRYNSRLLRSTR